MKKNAVIQGAYADFKLVKTRGVVQMVIEVPIEQAREVVDMFGIPNPASEISVAVAALVENVRGPEKRKFEDMKASQQAGILCHDRRFQEWCGCDDAASTARVVKAVCRVETRADLATNQEAADQWVKMVSRYRQETGLDPYETI